MIMNLTQLTTFVALSACAIAEIPTAASANVIPTPESVAEIQVPDSIIQLENATIQSIAQPEMVSQTPEVMITATPAPIESIGAAMDSSIEPTAKPVLNNGADDRIADTRIADRRADTADTITTSTVTPRIEVGTRGIPPVTDLPDRVSLPSRSLLPANFEYPIVLGQAMDQTITTTSPITDRMADPVWSRRMEDLNAYKAAYSENLVAWSGRVAKCMNEKPKLYVLRSDGKQLPMYFDGNEGTIVQNKDGVSVCGM